MKIASWNVNSIRSRLPLVVDWLKRTQIDVLCLQELKCQNEQFPYEAIKDAGYEALVHGQKAYNGVAILSKKPMTEIGRTIGDDQSRYIEADINGMRIINVYAPNGNPLGTPKFEYKLDWLERLYKRAQKLLKDEVPFLITGDINIIPEPIDAAHPERWKNDALFQPEPRAIYRRFLNLGLTDALRMHHPEAGVYTFWDYLANSWVHDNGIRIDHFLLSPQLADKCADCFVDRDERGREKASDHAPIVITIPS